MKSFIINLAKQSGKVLMKHYGKVKSIKAKGKTSYVTNVDLESEKLIISTIRKKFPDHSIISEEAGNLIKKSDYTWYIDPLDGTHNYMNNFPLFGVSIGLAYKGKMKYGAINLSYFNETYYAEKGKGSFLNGKRIKVSNKKSAKKSFVISDLALRYEVGKKIRLFNKLRGKIYDLRLLGCAVFGYTLVAKGSADAYITTYTCPWDVAAGALIVEEAKGKVTDFNGDKWNPHMGRYISSNKKIHNQLSKAIK